MTTIPISQDEEDLITIPISQDEGTFTEPPSLRQVKLNKYVKWVVGDGVRAFAITFEDGSPFEDNHFFFQRYPKSSGEVLDTQGEDGKKAVKRGIFHYTVTVTAKEDGKTWVSGSCELHVN